MVSTENERYKIGWWASRGLPSVVELWEEETVNPGGIIRNRFIKWVAGTYQFTSNYDLALRDPTTALVSAGQNLRIAVQETPYYSDPVPAPVPVLEPPKPRYYTEVIDEYHHIEHDGSKSRSLTLTPFGWSVGPWE